VGIRTITAIALAASVAGALAGSTTRAADAAYVGTWKLNTAKSVLAGDTVTIGSAAGGMMQFSSQGFAYAFKLDGHEYPTPDGGTTAWTATSTKVWDVKNQMHGKVSATYHLVLEGDALGVSGQTMKADGTAMDFSSSYKRVSGGPGFAGKWMSTKVQMPASTLKIAANGPNGLSLSDDSGPIGVGQFDSTDTPAVGMMAGSKVTYAYRKISDRSFEVTSKLDGKTMYVDVYAVSADGKTLTDSGTPSAAKTETFKVVYDRQ
jgi:hypothetical protein